MAKKSAKIKETPKKKGKKPVAVKKSKQKEIPKETAEPEKPEKKETTREVKKTAKKKEEKSPILAAILSFLITGVGQIYNGQITKGIILLLAHLGMWIVVFVLSYVLIGCCMVPIPILIWVYSIYDAYKTAERINAGEKVKDMEW